MRVAFLALFMAGVTMVPACTRTAAEPGTSPAPASSSSAQLANPASAHCVESGGRLSLEKDGGGGEFGVCLFEDNYQCEEWALLRGQCRAGGVRITGYATAAGRYCAIRGGRYTVTSGAASDERGNCALPDGRSCDADEFFGGTCGR